MIYFCFLILILVTLLSDALSERNSKLSKEIVDRMQKLLPDLKNQLLSASILLVNDYASHGDILKFEFN